MKYQVMNNYETMINQIEQKILKNERQPTKIDK